jgi:uncharacterized protein YjbK
LKELYISHKKISTENQQELLNELNITYLIKKDPTTCTHYYKHIINAMKLLICLDETFFGKVLDYFLVTEFQNRGNGHDHFMLWVNDAPICGKDTNTNIENFVDRYINCNTESL